MHPRQTFRRQLLQVQIVACGSLDTVRHGWRSDIGSNVSVAEVALAIHWLLHQEGLLLIESCRQNLVPVRVAHRARLASCAERVHSLYVVGLCRLDQQAVDAAAQYHAEAILAGLRQLTVVVERGAILEGVGCLLVRALVQRHHLLTLLLHHHATVEALERLVLDGALAEEAALAVVVQDVHRLQGLPPLVRLVGVAHA